MILFDVRSSAGALEASLAMPEGAPRLAVALCHGQPSGFPADPDDPGYPGVARRLAAELGAAAVAFSFRGCHGSPGNYSIDGMVEDLRAVVDALNERVRAPVAVVGASMGGAVALLEAANDDRVALVATLAAPAHFDDIARPGAGYLEHVRSLGLFRDPGYPPNPAAWLDAFARARAENARLGSRSLLVIHSRDDDVVPFEHARRIVRRASGPVTFVSLGDAGHRLRHDRRALGALFAWLRAQRREDSGDEV